MRARPPLALVLLAFSLTAPLARAANVTEPPPYDQFILIPLRVHVLTSSDIEEIDCKLTDADVARILAKVNGVWNKAGIHFGLESIVREPAAEQERFRKIRAAYGGAPLGLFSILRPEASRTFDGLHVYYVHQLPVNGVYMGEDYAIVRETAQLREVEGGIDEPIPRVTSHELGHALGLPHRQDTTNLLASGTTGTLLNEAEVATAREKAAQTKGAATVADWAKKAEELAGQSDREGARRVWTWLSQIPGTGAASAHKQLRGLAPPRFRSGTALNLPGLTALSARGRALCR